MSLKYALHLTASERQDLTRITQGRGGRRRPPLWPAVRARALLKCDAGPQGAGWTRTKPSRPRWTSRRSA